MLSWNNYSHFGSFGGRNNQSVRISHAGYSYGSVYKPFLNSKRHKFCAVTLFLNTFSIVFDSVKIICECFSLISTRITEENYMSVRIACMTYKSVTLTLLSKN